MKLKSSAKFKYDIKRLNQYKEEDNLIKLKCGVKKKRKYDKKRARDKKFIIVFDYHFEIVSKYLNSNFTYEDISLRCNIPVSTVKSIIYKYVPREVIVERKAYIKDTNAVIKAMYSEKEKALKRLGL